MAGDDQPRSTNANQKVLQYFWDLASLDEKERRTAAQELFEELSKGSPSEEPIEHATDAADGESIDSILAQCPPVVGYCLRRLVRGLASGRQAARQGYATSLAALLGSRSMSLSAGDLQMLIEKLLAPRHSMSKTENSDALIGRLFGYGALVRSGIAMTRAEAVRLAEEVVSLGESRSFLTEAAANLVLELVPQLDEATRTAVLTAEKGPRSWLHAPVDQAKPEALVLALRLWPYLPSSTVAACKLLPANCSPLPTSFWTNPGSVPRSVVEPIASAVFRAPFLTSVLPLLLRTEQCHPRLHSVWIVMLQLLLPGFGTKQVAEADAAGGEAVPAAPSAPPTPAHLEAFWRVAVEGGLLDGKSPLRQYAALRLLKLALPYLASSNVHILLGRPLVGLLHSNLKSPDRLLHAKARHIVAQLQGQLQRGDPEESVKMAVLSALSTLGFAKASSKAAKQQGMDASSVAGHVERMIASFVSPPETDTAAEPPKKKKKRAQEEHGEEGAEAEAQGGADDSRRSWAVDQLAGVLRNPQAGAPQRLQALRFLATVALFTVKNAKKAANSKFPEVQQLSSCDPPPSPQLQQQCAARLVAGIAASMRQQQPGGRHKAPAPGAAANGTPPADEDAPEAPPQQKDIVKSLMAYIGKLEGSAALQPARPLDERQQAALDALKALGQALAEHTTDTPQAHGRLRALAQLVQLLHLYMLSDPAGVEADLALDLRMVAEQGLGVKMPEGAQGEADDEGEEEGEEEGAKGERVKAGWADVLVDVLLSLLARPSEPLPSAPLRDCAEALFRACCGQLTAMGLQDMVRVVGRMPSGAPQEQGDEDIFDGEDEEEEVEEGGESSEEESDDEMQDGEEKAAGVAAEEGDGSGEDDMEVDDDMDDEAMFRMDKQIATYLRSVVDSRQSGREQAAALFNFKLRVLALLELFIRKAQGSGLMLALAAPLLLALSRASRQPGELDGRLAAVCEALSHTRPAVTGTTAEEMKAVLKRVLYHAARERSPAVNKAAGRLLEWLLRCCAREGGELLEAAREAYSGAVVHFFHNRSSRLPLSLLRSVQAALPAVSTAVLPALLTEATSGRNAVKQVEALGLAAEALKRPAALELVKGSAASLCAALQHAVEGPFDRQSRHAEALGQAAALVRALRSTAGATRLSQLIGGESLNALAKSIKAVQEVELFGSGKMKGQLDNLIARLDIEKLLDVTKADATRASRLRATYEEKYTPEPSKPLAEGETAKTKQKQHTGGSSSKKAGGKPGKAKEQQQHQVHSGKPGKAKQQQQSQANGGEAGKARQQQQQQGQANGGEAGKAKQQPQGQGKGAAKEGADAKSPQAKKRKHEQGDKGRPVVPGQDEGAETVQKQAKHRQGRGEQGANGKERVGGKGLAGGRGSEQAGKKRKSPGKVYMGTKPKRQLPGTVQ